MFSIHLIIFTIIKEILFYSRVVIGAPNASTSAIQQGVKNGGAVYKCKIIADNQCVLIPFDSEGK